MALNMEGLFKDFAEIDKITAPTIDPWDDSKTVAPKPTVAPLVAPTVTPTVTPAVAPTVAPAVTPTIAPKPTPIDPWDDSQTTAPKPTDPYTVPNNDPSIFEDTTAPTAPTAPTAWELPEYAYGIKVSEINT